MDNAKNLMDQDINNLARLLSDQANKYKKLILLSREQASCLVNGDKAKISKLSQNSEDLLKQIKTVSKAADKVVSGLAVKLGVGKESSYLAVVEKLNGNGGQIKQSLQEIASLIAELAPENYKNALLIKQGIDIENFKLNIIKNQVSTENNIYSMNGKLNKKDGFLLDKQV